MNEHMAYQRLYMASLLLLKQAEQHPLGSEDIAILERYETRLKQAAVDYAVSVRPSEFDVAPTSSTGKTIAHRRIAFTKIISSLLSEVGTGHTIKEDEELTSSTVSRLLDVL